MPRTLEAPITPLKLPRGVRHLLIFGGSFDPPHFYHTIAPLSVVVRLYGKSGWVLYVPASRNPHKKGGPIASDEHRLAMLRAGLDVPGPRSVWTDELDRAAHALACGDETPSYTIDTLRRLRKIVPTTVKFRLLIGSDQAASFHRWKDSRKVIALAEPLVLVREPIVTACSLLSSLDHDFWTLEERRAWCTRLAPNFPLEQSSTDARAAIPGAPKSIRQWDKREGLAGIVAPVARYIIKHNLYGFRRGQPHPATEIPIPSGDRSGVLRRLERSATTAITDALISPVRLKQGPRRRP